MFKFLMSFSLLFGSVSAVAEEPLTEKQLIECAKELGASQMDCSTDLLIASRTKEPVIMQRKNYTTNFSAFYNSVYFKCNRPYELPRFRQDSLSPELGSAFLEGHRLCLKNKSKKDEQQNPTPTAQ